MIVGKVYSNDDMNQFVQGIEGLTFVRGRREVSVSCVVNITMQPLIRSFFSNWRLLKGKGVWIH